MVIKATVKATVNATKKTRLLHIFAFAILLLGCEPEEDEIVKIEVNAVTLSNQELTLFKGDTHTLTANVLPVDATDKTILWESDRPDIATVNNGVVKGITIGNAIITATAGSVQAECSVSVLEAPAFSFGTMSTDAAIINGAGGSTSISITAESEWALESKENWLEVSPSSGQAGTHVITITTSKNSSGKDRNGVIALTPGSQSQKLTVCQRPYIYSRRQAISGTVSNAVKVTYSGTEWNSIYSVLPYPKSNLYQDIRSVNTYGATIYDCPDSVNSYIVSKLTENDVPASGNNVIMENISAVGYHVTAQLDLIKNIPHYDQNSFECRNYLGKEDGDLVDPWNSDIVSVANSLWSDSNGNLIDYARSCYEWTATNMTYGNMNTGLHTMTELMSTKTGDCGNFSSVFISLLRAKGIPARHIVMISPQENGYHVRAEFYIPAYGWIPADPTFKNGDPRGDYFGKFTGEYIIMSLGVNPIIKDPDDNDCMVSIMQSYFYWYWYYNEGSYIDFQHVFSKFK